MLTAADGLDADGIARVAEQLRSRYPIAAVFIADRAAHYCFGAIAAALRTPCPPG